MKRLLTWLAVALLSLFAVAGAGAGYLFAAFPRAIELDSGRVVPTPELVERGEYLVEHVALCTDCHSRRDFSRFSGPIHPETKGAGGERFGREIGLPGDIYSRNITPAALGDWSDGELKRAIGSGVSKSGSALFPLMPYRYYGHLCERDLSAIVAYIRTLAPVASEVPERSLDFPVNLLVRTMPAPRDPWPCPDQGDSVSRGKYLVTIGVCADCHTKSDQGNPLPGMDFAGGMEFPLPSGGTVRSANLTPDRETGLGAWTREHFVTHFKNMRGKDAAYPVNKGEFNSFMPWSMYAGMTDEDLGAIYDFLRTQKPVRHAVVKFSP